MDVEAIRKQVFVLYGVPVSEKELSSKTLKKAHYCYLSDKDFVQKIRETK